jgi:hypothetical protein
VKKMDKKTSLGRWKMFAVLAVCAAPMVFSYFAYYVIKPSGRSNYGTILDPRLYPMPVLGSSLLGGEAKELAAYKGKWIMLQVDGGACADACRKKLYNMRQLRVMQGKNMDRLETVWLITDDQPLETIVMRDYEGTHMIKARMDLLDKWLPTEGDSKNSEHIYMIDPLGNLMMRFPKDADPNKMKKDLSKLLRASAIG